MNQSIIVTMLDERPKITIERKDEQNIRISIEVRLFDTLMIRIPNEVWEDIKAIARANDEGFKI